MTQSIESRLGYPKPSEGPAQRRLSSFHSAFGETTEPPGLPVGGIVVHESAMGELTRWRITEKAVDPWLELCPDMRIS